MDERNALLTDDIVGDDGITSSVDVPISIFLSFTIAIEHEVFESIGEMMIGKKTKIIFVEFKLRGKLIPNLEKFR